MTTENILPCLIPLLPELNSVGQDDNRFVALLDTWPCLCPCLV